MNGTCLTGCEAGFQGELCKTRKYKPTRTQVFKCIKEYHNDRQIGLTYTRECLLSGNVRGYMYDYINTRL